MRLNLGCGSRKFPGWVNVDKVAACQPDQVADLETFPWPWATDSVDEIFLAHVLEHLGAATPVYQAIIQEMYRVCRDDAKVTIIVPHPRHDNFLNDPTHVRAVTDISLSLFSQKLNRENIAAGAANTPLGVYWGVDFAIESAHHDLEEPWAGRFQRNEVSNDELQNALKNYNNVVLQTEVVLRAVKPAGRID